MFVAVVHFPSVPAERDAAFRAWFAWSNDQLRDAPGLAGRRLLRGEDGSYVGLVEHDSDATFAEMHTSSAAGVVQRALHEILDGAPRAEIYELVEASPGGRCCRGAGHERGSVEVTATAAPASCCGG